MKSAPQQTTTTVCYQSPIGPLLIEALPTALTAIHWPDQKADLAGAKSVIGAAEKHALPTLLKETLSQLNEYFAGTRKAFDLPIAPEGTGFQQQVWQVLEDIPWGSTLSYGQVAHSIEKPRAVRAVGRAIGANPIPIIIPCHRVIGSTGALTGFAGGLDRKKWLLQHEGYPIS